MIKKDNYITPRGLRKLQDELNELTRKERPNILKVISWAASNGDRSENADYIYGKKKLREIDRRIRFLTKRIDSAIEVDNSNLSIDIIKFGATVEALNELEEMKVFTLVGVDEIDLSKNFISWKSPIGKAFLNKMVGDEVIVKGPMGEIYYEVTSIEYKEFL